MDEFIQWPKPYLLLWETCDKTLSWMLETLDEKSPNEWQKLQHCKSITPKFIYNGWQIILGWDYISSTLIDKKRRSRSKFASHYTWRTNGVCKCKMDVKSTWISTWHETIHVSWSLELFFQKPPLGGTPNTKPWDHRTLNAHNRCFILLYHLRRPTWIQNHWNSIWLRAWSHMTSHYTWGSMTTSMILEVCCNGLWTLSFGLSQFHRHGSWLVCEVALITLLVLEDFQHLTFRVLAGHATWWPGDDEMSL
jgi:hypothetical protein